MFIMFESEYKRARAKLKNMQRYLEMGYDEESARVAVERYGDDLHAGCHWLMMRETLGQCPKRLRIREVPETYIGSSIRYFGSTYTVDKYDKKHALIRINDKGSRLWVHMSDQRIDWVTLRHDSTEVNYPVAAWRRRIGKIKINLTGIESRSEITQNNCLELYLKEGRPSLSDTFDVYTQRLFLWRSIFHLTRTFIHKPSGSRPYGISNHDIHSFRVEWMSYFHCVCEVHHVDRNEFSTALFSDQPDSILEKFPEDIRPRIQELSERWRNPRPYLRAKGNTWKSKCLPLVEFVCEDMEGDTATLSVGIHDMSFVRPACYDAAVHQHLQRIFKYIYGKDSEDHSSGALDTRFFKNVLRVSKKSRRRVEPADIMETPLMSYQKKCLSWLIYRETRAKPISSWGWSKHELSDGFMFFTSSFGQMTLTAPNDSVRGGLLAQDVGMGKTVEMLALIASRPRDRPTLVVVPTTMLSIWVSEAKKHVPSLKTLAFHGARRPRNMDILRAQDIVVTTYRICMNETQRHVPTLGAIRWQRLILDESHELRNPMSATVRAVCRLYAPYRWCISATPFNHNASSLASMLAFFSVQPFDEMPTAQLTSGLTAAQHMLRPSSNHSTTLFSRLISELTLWEQKRHVRMGFQPMTFEVVQLAHRSNELYERLRHMIALRIEQDRQQYSNIRTRILNYARWLAVAATQPRLLEESVFGELSTSNRAHAEKTSVQSYVDTLGNTDYDDALRNTIASIDNETCAICMSAMDRPTVTPCQHLFCYECIQSAYEHDMQRRCPLCRAPAGVNGLHELTLSDTCADNTDDKIWRIFDYLGREVSMPKAIHKKYQTSAPSHKIEALLERLNINQDKWVVFTQYHLCWKYIGEQLRQHGVRFTSIEGRMTPQQRAQAVKDFQEDDEVRVFVLTTKTAAVGLTLTAARHVLFMEPCNDTNLRKQAIGRIRRIGQTHPVTIHTFKTLSSIESVKSRHITEYLTNAS